MPSKSTSRAHVPDLISTIKKPENQRPLSLGHRRSQSETINTKTTKTERLTNVRPRYLEPKSTHSKLSAVKAISHSSSDSSRNASPSNRHHAPTMLKKQQNKENDSTNMSRDSLSSPAKVNKLLKNRSSHDIDRSIDSLGESMLSSIKTEKTLSQESIIIKRKDNLTKPALKSISRSNPVINKQSSTVAAAAATKMRPLSNKFIAKPRPLSGQTTNENSPSSVTTKSSRLSSLSSPRDVHKTINHQSAPAKKSFLSAKSKEILAKKQQLNHTDSTRSVPAAVRAEKTISVNKSQSTSNVPHSKPNPFNTTLHLRRTAKLDDEKPVKKSGSATKADKVPTTNGKTNGKVVNGRSSGKCEKKLEKVCIEIEPEVEENVKPVRIDSRLERSSTFCKESSDVPLSELQIIE